VKRRGALRVVIPQMVATASMKSLFLCLLMMSIVLAAYGPPSPALRRLVNRR
jgi:hypothetical protein